MCTKTPKVQQPKDKPVQYLRNPFLDGLAIGQGQGRDSLRIDLGSRPAQRPVGDNGRLTQLPTPLPGNTPRTTPGLFIPPPKGGGGGRTNLRPNKY